MIIKILHDLLRGHRAIARKVVRLAFLELVDDRSGDLFGNVVKLLLHRISAVVSGTPFNDFDTRIRNQLQGIARLQANILPRR